MNQEMKLAKAGFNLVGFSSKHIEIQLEGVTFPSRQVYEDEPEMSFIASSNGRGYVRRDLSLLTWECGRDARGKWERAVGFNPLTKKRDIRADIKKAIIAEGKCSKCGLSCAPAVDHRNGRYNDPDALSLNTQKIEHFQPLCQSCNTIKRHDCKHCIETDERYRRMPRFFSQGDEVYDAEIGCKGCPWYEAESFRTTAQARIERRFSLTVLN